MNRSLSQSRKPTQKTGADRLAAQYSAHLAAGELEPDGAQRAVVDRLTELAESLEKLTDEKKQKIIEALEKIVKKGVKIGGEETGSEKESEKTGN